MYSLVLRIPGSATGLAEKSNPSPFNVDDTPITRMCDATGGMVINLAFLNSFILPYLVLVQTLVTGEKRKDFLSSSLQ